MVTYSICDFAGTALSYYSFIRGTVKHKVHVKSFTKCEISNDLHGAEDMWYCKKSRVQTVTVMIMYVTAVVIVGDCIMCRNFVCTAILLSTHESEF